jgi:cyanophycinase
VAQTSCERPCVGPSSGTLVLAGGGELGDEIFRHFVELAGGSGANIVVIPTAAAEETFGPDWPGLRSLQNAGATRLTILHTRDRHEADSPRFVAPLREADAVWIPGGRQGRLVDAYLGTRTHAELQRVLERGGVIGGSSAGASMLASYLVRGAIESNEVLMAPGYEEGFGLLRNAAVDQHVIARYRVHDMLLILQEHPGLLGIGLDEGAAMIVTGDRAEVVGRSAVAVYDPADADRLFYWLEPGDVFDLGARTLQLTEPRLETEASGPRGGSATSAAVRDLVDPLPHVLARPLEMVRPDGRLPILLVHAEE